MKYGKYLALWIACTVLVGQGWIAVVAGVVMSTTLVWLYSPKKSKSESI